MNDDLLRYVANAGAALLQEYHTNPDAYYDVTFGDFCRASYDIHLSYRSSHGPACDDGEYQPEKERPFDY